MTTSAPVSLATREYRVALVLGSVPIRTLILTGRDALRAVASWRGRTPQHTATMTPLHPLPSGPPQVTATLLSLARQMDYRPRPMGKHERRRPEQRFTMPGSGTPWVFLAPKGRAFMTHSEAVTLLEMGA